MCKNINFVTEQHIACIFFEGQFSMLCRADLDPIYYCELLETCAIKDDGDAKINSVVIDPQTVVRGEAAEGINTDLFINFQC